MTISLKDRVFHRQLHTDTEIAGQLALQLRAQVNAEYTRIANSSGERALLTLVAKWNDAEYRAGEFRRRENDLVHRVLS